ncbi:hypothetical protein AB6N24_17535 [Cellulomonas sp. 179-A 4D5 NHS]|uniref:hypothetical protein n=1 Tax=Cellulomonas sp. 179-A 4D5 NHS TaxID=3142378 RepID=UPI0039A318FD
MTEGDTDDLMAALSGLLDHVGELEAVMRSTARGATAEIDELRTVVLEVARRLDQLQPAPEPTSDPEPAPVPHAWVDVAEPDDWAVLGEWVDWLHRTYDLPLKVRVRPCWPAHRGVAEELAALRTSWQAAALAAGQATQPGDDLATWHERHLHPCLDRIRSRYAIADCEDGHTAPLSNRPTDTHLLRPVQNAAVRTPSDLIYRSPRG